MNLIVVPDIFGKTVSLTQLIERLSPFYSEVTVIDPYNGQNISFENEENAYQHFQQYCGIEELTQMLGKELIKSQQATDIIGFSVGGTSAWEISAKGLSKYLRNVVSFYSSRIRDKTDIAPQTPTSLVFPAVEQHFELEPVIQAVENKPNVEVIRTSYLHGFMNSESKNFSAAGYQHFSDWLANKAG
jgi:dienelactone hydrolase